jgi:hypothetical protein
MSLRFGGVEECSVISGGLDSMAVDSASSTTSARSARTSAGAGFGNRGSLGGRGRLRTAGLFMRRDVAATVPLEVPDEWSAFEGSRHHKEAPSIHGQRAFQLVPPLARLTN